MVAKPVRSLILFIPFVLLVACQMVPVEESDVDFETATRHEPEEVDTQVLIQEPDNEGVLDRLQREALILQSEGRWSEAELKLERALRIDSQQSILYEQLATVRMGQSRFAEAEQIALKGLSISNQTSEQKAVLWQVIAQCRAANSDIKGANEARKERERWLKEITEY